MKKEDNTELIIDLFMNVREDDLGKTEDNPIKIESVSMLYELLELLAFKVISQKMYTNSSIKLKKETLLVRDVFTNDELQLFVEYPK
ncbi:hypothetical protein OAF80_00395 [bacterium]|nr:hypothetical protein [bacterium]